MHKIEVTFQPGCGGGTYSREVDSLGKALDEHGLLANMIGRGIARVRTLRPSGAEVRMSDEANFKPA